MKACGNGLILKLNFEKAYDRVNWHFLKFVVSRMGFGEKWILWIYRCISVAPVSILVNETPGPRFSMNCMLRQGCPLSPFLFNLVAEAFPILFNQFQAKGWLARFNISGVQDPYLCFNSQTIQSSFFVILMIWLRGCNVASLSFL